MRRSVPVYVCVCASACMCVCVCVHTIGARCVHVYLHKEKEIGREGEEMWGKREEKKALHFPACSWCSVALCVAPGQHLPPFHSLRPPRAEEQR